MNRLTFGLRLLLGALWAPLLAGSCGPGPISPEVAGPLEYSPVFLLGTEQLDPPAVGREPVFKVAYLGDIDPDDSSRGRTAGFFVTLGTAAPHALMFRLVDLESRVVRRLTAVAPPGTPSEVSLGSAPRAFNGPVRALVASGRGIFWPTGPGAVNEELEHRFAVLIPERLLSPFTRLEAYTRQADDGTPLGTAHIDLVQDFFYLVVLGDSVQWGNGLREEHKMSARVAKVIERETRRKVIRQRYAQSGATILPEEGDGICAVNCVGEVPTARTSITMQADQIQRPELVDLILMDGCVNDVGVGIILDPLVPEEDLADLTQRFCEEEMARLLEKVHALTPQARIIVTGYYQIVGPDSDLFALQAWLDTHGVEAVDGALTSVDPETPEPGGGTQGQDAPPSDLVKNDDPENGEDRDNPPATDDTIAGEAAALVALLTARSVIFHETAHHSLAEAVDLINSSSGDDPMIAFADPGFGPQNAVFGPDRWLWSMTAESELFEGIDFALELFPEDPLTDLRVSACFDADVVCDPITCLYASVGHPNPRGAQAYADAIIHQLRALGVLCPMTSRE